MKRLGCEELASGKWLALYKIDYEDNRGVKRVWESVARKKSAGAVAIICTLKPSNRLVLVRQYRPAADGMVIEFPAGLVEGDETPEKTAVRELREETGYRGKLLHMAPDSFSSPGLSPEIVRLAIMEADENAQDDLATDFDESEDIETILVLRAGLPDYLRAALRRGELVDGRVSAFAVGMSLR